MKRAVDSVFDKAVEQLDREERRLGSLEKTGTVATFDRDGFAAMNRALSYVVMGGVLEELMRDLPAALAADLVAQNIERRHLPVSLIAAIDASSFRQCGSDTVASLIARANVVQAVASHGSDSRPVVDFGELFKLADGSTINEKHFKALWALLGLDGDWRSDPKDTMLLKEIRDKRNDVAHWLEDPVTVGRSKRPSDLKTMVKGLIDLVQHFHLAIWYWLDDRAASVKAVGN
ncbi:hypothetical protein [Streptomyces sp. NPDC008139]|uniref:hypothetical protein n=1 Tax=Streptomyces sp. NPDC008139 TaxID=3364814 RepID=UPI0036E37365